MLQILINQINKKEQKSKNSEEKPIKKKKFLDIFKIKKKIRKNNAIKGTSKKCRNKKIEIET